MISALVDPNDRCSLLNVAHSSRYARRAMSCILIVRSCLTYHAPPEDYSNLDFKPDIHEHMHQRTPCPSPTASPIGSNLSTRAELRLSISMIPLPGSFDQFPATLFFDRVAGHGTACEWGAGPRPGFRPRVLNQAYPDLQPHLTCFLGSGDRGKLFPRR